MPKIVVSNTSPIFYLHRVGYLELLKRLYREIIVPNAVIEELEEGRKQGEDVPDPDHRKISGYNYFKLFK